MKRRRTTMPAWPLYLRRAQERAAARAARRKTWFALTSTIVMRDVSLVALVGLILFVLVWVSR